jgi:hypothetical protein
MKLSEGIIIFIVSNLVTFAFGAGGMYFLIRQVRNQLNGVGKKVGKLQMVVLTFCPQEQREKIAGMLQ